MNKEQKLKGYVVAFDDITDLASAQGLQHGVMLQEELLMK